ncbi:MAG: Spo0E family sporulation regulatory protein-aspartic acid phosphatase [Caloramator sp.]|nr:Spo0E family sporulation regulatory protein-aspartic acid phosphatase [Caloramator sp.]
MIIKELLSKEMQKLNKMIEKKDKYSNEDILKQSQLVDRLIVDFMKKTSK